MALIGRIRKNTWLLITVIGLALAAFILMDMMSGQQSLLGGQPSSYGKIGDQSIDINEFNRTESILRDFLYRGSNVDAYALKNQVWNYLIESKLVNKEADVLGLGVPKDELMELQFGNNLSPIISQRFMNQQTRQVDKQALDSYKQQIEGNTMTNEFKMFWAHQEKEVVKQRLQDKIAKMASAAIYTPSWMTDAVNQDVNGSMNLEVVKVDYANVPSSDITLSDDDFKNYYAANSFRYKQDEETRKVEYISFNVEATKEDSAVIRNQLAEKIEFFRATQDDSTYVENNFGVMNPSYMTTENLPNAIQNRVIADPIGTVIGPYVEGTNYVLTKIVDRVAMADSADTRHILISATTPEEFVNATARIDSFKTVIQNGSAKFADLATKFSQDPGSKDKGGKYENVTPNQFVPEYNDVLFVTGRIGQLYPVRTSYGVHLVEILSRDRNSTPRVKLANISQSIMPSDETQKKTYDMVYNIIKDNNDMASLKAAVQGKPNVQIETTSAFKKNDFSLGQLGGGQSSRDIIRWASGESDLGSPSVGKASPEVYAYQDQALFYNNKYVLAGLSQIIPEGTPSWQDLRTELEPFVINKKKAEILKGKMNSQDLAALAAQNNTTVEAVNNVRFVGGAPAILSGETDVIAQLSSLAANAVSQPIEGNSGVYVAKVLNKTAASAPNLTAIKSNVEGTYKGRLTSSLMQAVKKAVGVSDERATFF